MKFRQITIFFFLLFLVSAQSRTFFVSDKVDNIRENQIRSNQVQELVKNMKFKVDSVLFHRGERYFINISLDRDTQNNIYFGAYGDSLLSDPVLDGSIYRFDFDKSNWKDYEIINGVKFYKKNTGKISTAYSVSAGITKLIPAREPDMEELTVTGTKNSFAGYFKVDSVDSARNKSIFFDKDNKMDWAGAELVMKTRLWQYEVREIKSSFPYFEVTEPTVNPMIKDWGYFIQKHYYALDSQNEWYHDKQNNILYFSTDQTTAAIYLSGAEEENSGFYIKNKKGIIIKDLRFENFRYGIFMQSASDIKISNNSFRNCSIGITNKKTYIENCEIENNRITNMDSYGIRVIGNNMILSNNSIDSIGLSLGAENRGLINLVGIEIYGKGNRIRNNTIKNTGYCGIRFFGSGEVEVYGNTVENTVLAMSDGGGIYTWHYLEGSDSKIIRKNTVKNAYGNADGTSAGTYFKSNGIYLDELSLHFRVDSNYVSDCGGGIYLQNSRNDTIVNNTLKNTNTFLLHINHAGSILNGGRLNISNDPDFDPDTLSFIPEGYFWDREERILYYKNKRSGTVYIEPGGNLIKDNIFFPDSDKFTFTFRTWKHINDDTLYELTGIKDFFRNNIPVNLLKDASFQIIGGNVKDFYQNGKNFDNLKSTFDNTKYDYLNKTHIYIGRGAKYKVEK